MFQPAPEIPTADDDQRQGSNDNCHSDSVTSTQSEDDGQGASTVKPTQNVSEMRQVEILKTVVQYKNGQIFEWGHKAKVLEECLGPLNSLEIFNGSMKLSTLKERWRKAEKIAEGIIADEEKFVKLSQNGGKDMTELDTLYLNLAQRMKQHGDQKQKEKDEHEANAKDAAFRLSAALTGVAKRCGYEWPSQAEKMLADDMADVKKEYSPSVASCAGQKRSPSTGPEKTAAEKTAEDAKKPEQQFGRGNSHGLNKRAKADPALRLDREGSSSDPLSSLGRGSDRLYDLLQAQGEGDRQVMAEIARAQVMQAQAERLKQAAAAAQAFIQAQSSGVDLPPGLMAMFNNPDST